MSAGTRTRPAPRRPVPMQSWEGDPLILVYAVRHAVTLPPASHVCRFVLQSIETNIGHLPLASRRVIARDIASWLDGPGANASDDDRAVWIAALAVLGVE